MFWLINSIVDLLILVLFIYLFLLRLLFDYTFKFTQEIWVADVNFWSFWIQNNVTLLLKVVLLNK